MKTEQLTRLQMENIQMEYVNKSIKDSINYARIIQNAMTPGLNKLRRSFPDSFIFDQPKDIISGDFCWFSEVGDDFVIAVADCTGHGVPGAMISMTGFTLLNEIVSKSRVTNPAEVLRYLSDGFVNILSRGAEHTELLDGMDISVCLLRRKEMILEFAGANRPVFIVNKGVVRILKGDKHSIGLHPLTSKTTFTNHVISLKSGDRIIFSTDGITDQFGGRADKKFMRRNFIKMLELSSHFSAVKTGDFLEKIFHRWKGSNDQTDDVLVAGIQL